MGPQGQPGYDGAPGKKGDKGDVGPMPDLYPIEVSLLHKMERFIDDRLKKIEYLKTDYIQVKTSTKKN